MKGGLLERGRLLPVGGGDGASLMLTQVGEVGQQLICRLSAKNIEMNIQR